VLVELGLVEQRFAAVTELPGCSITFGTSEGFHDSIGVNIGAGPAQLAFFRGQFDQSDAYLSTESNSPCPSTAPITSAQGLGAQSLLLDPCATVGVQGVVGLKGHTIVAMSLADGGRVTESEAAAIVKSALETYAS
jgi:hypothetical protein